MDNLAAQCVIYIQVLVWNEAHREISTPLWQVIAPAIMDEIENAIGDDIRDEIWRELRDDLIS